MSELFDQDPRDPAPPPPRTGRSRALIATGIVLVVAFFGLTTFATVFTERLWFRDLGYGSVFSTLLWTRVVLFVVFALVMALAVSASMYVAFRTRPLFHPNSPEQTGLDRYREAITPIRTWLTIGVAVVLGIFAGTSGVGQWRSYLLWRNGGDFDVSDPYFKRDVGFYVFDLPWLHYLVDYAMAVAVVAVLAAALVHYLYGGIRLQSPGDRMSGAAQVQLSVLLGIFVLAKSGDYWLDRFDLTSQSGSLLTGITYTDDNALLPAKNILIGIGVICALLLFLNVWRRTWMLPSVGIALLALSAVLLGMIWPALVQQFQVKPTEADKEESYIAANIEATRAAFDLDDVEITGAPDDRTEDAALGQEIANTPVRLVDPNVVPAAFEQAQQVRGYYSVADVLDVDRYDVDGTPRDVVLGVRELNQAGISESSQNWANLHTVYTHGDGIVAAYGNQRARDNQEVVTTQEQEPEWAGPPRGDLTDVVGEYESRIYFGEGSPEYSIVGKKSEGDRDLELDVPIGVADDAQATSTYDGETGVPVGGLFNKLLYAVKFGEPNIVLSDRVHENSRIIYDRDPAEMVEKVAPWLTVDGDPVPSVVDGKVVWILDGYTTSDRYPQSQKESFDDMTDDSLQDASSAFQTLPTDEINYIRNAVKATVDAYDGTVTLYAWDEDDPMLKAWRGAFPGTVKDRSEISDGLLAHLRYPEDLFKAQRYQLARYHVTDAGDFYQDNERWEVPEDPNSGSTSLQPPYRLTIGNAEGGSDFAMTSTFVPFNRQNLAGFMSVVADATSENYGKIQVLDVSQGNQVQGPGQVAATINADTNLQNALLNFTAGSQTQPVYGNLLTVPVGGRLLYVQPIYTIRQTGEGRFPVFQFVALSFGDDVGFGRSLSSAVADLLDVKIGPGPGTGTDGGDGEGEDPTQSVDEQIRSLLTRAETRFTEAEAALAEGKLGEYQSAVEAAQNLITRALELDATRPDAPGGGAADETTDEPGSEPETTD